ncbi:MAG: Fic family protein [Nitrospirota bacterium]
MNRSGKYIKQPAGYRAFIPNPLPPKPPITMDEKLQDLLSKADMSIARLDGMGFILPMSLGLIKEIHAVLMKGVRGGEKNPGEFRRSQNWIGPAGGTLNEATFIPPPPHEAEKAMGGLEKYMHETWYLLTLVNCALIHYQFETIHPFLDGNGRLGRLLITFYLYWKEVLQKPLLYLSYFFKKHRQEYYDRLNMVRENGNYEQWVAFFLTQLPHFSDQNLFKSMGYDIV